MAAYFIRRFLLIIPTLIGITVMVFVITRLVPGGPIERMILEARQMQVRSGGLASGPTEQQQPLSEGQIAQLRAYYGFDKPVLRQLCPLAGEGLEGAIWALPPDITIRSGR